MGWKLEILTVGKTKESWLKEALLEFEKRLKGRFEISYTYAANDESLERLILKREHLVFLDPQGKMFTSERFSSYFFGILPPPNETLTFVIGGAMGIPRHLLQLGDSISLSKMTLTHQMARLFLVEQIYRASEIERGSPYHK